MKKILAILGLACLASCASHQVANNVSLITFDDKVESAKSIGNVEGKDCTWSAFGYNLGDDPSVLRAFDNAANQRKGSFMLVNEELSALETGILDLLDRLAPKGRLMVISFHSSEDRIVKWTFKKAESKGKILTKKVIEPKWEETKNNVRARSAKLRVFERGEV